LYGDTVLSKTNKSSVLETLRSMKELTLGALSAGEDAEVVEELYASRTRRLVGSIR
jgi:hypothetical protein